jgi:hypothetical protein
MIWHSPSKFSQGELGSWFNFLFSALPQNKQTVRIVIAPLLDHDIILEQGEGKKA